MIKQLRWLSILSGVLSIIAGFYMLANPAVSLASLTLLFACVFMVNGISDIVNYFSKDSEKSGWNLFNGIITVILSIWLFTGTFFDIALFIPYLFTFWVLFSGISKTLIGIKDRKDNKNLGNYLLFMGIIGVIGGIIMIMHPLMTTVIIAYGIAFIFIYHGVLAVILFFKSKKEV